jgi:hypothetical protein
MLTKSWIYKTAKSLQGLATYDHEVLMSSQTRANFLGTHSIMSITVSVISDCNMASYLVVRDFLC